MQASINRNRGNVDPRIEQNHSISTSGNAFEFDSVRAQLPRSLSQHNVRNGDGYNSDDSSPHLIGNTRGRVAHPNSFPMLTPQNSILKKYSLGEKNKLVEQLNSIVEKANTEFLEKVRVEFLNLITSQTVEPKVQTEDMKNLAIEIVSLVILLY